MRRPTLAIASITIAIAAIGGSTTTAQTACDPQNGIGPDGGLPALPPPTEAGATFLGLAQDAAPVDMALDPATGLLFVVERGADDVVVIDAWAHVPSIVGSAKVGHRPTGLALDESSHRLFVANGSSCSVTVLDVSRPGPVILGTLASASGPRGVAVDPVSGRAWTANWSGEEITSIDGRADPPSLGGDPAPVGSGHVAVAVASGPGSVVLLSDAGIATFDSFTGAPKDQALPLPGGIDVATDGAWTAFVSQLAAGTVARVDVLTDPPTVVATSAPVAQEAFDIRYVASIDRLLLPSRTGEVLFLDPATLEVTDRVPSSPTPVAVLLDDATGRLWMLDYTYHRVWSVPLDPALLRPGTGQ